jgi:hypothetical protein
MSELSVVHAVRPYANEPDWLREEGWTIGRKSVYLIGIPPQPEGTRVRCELALKNGKQLLVAEGVVIKYAVDNGERPPGLVVRYRRLSTASSQFIDRVLNARDASELSSPSTTENPVVSSETNSRAEAAEHRFHESGAIRDLALSRLRGRPMRTPAPPRERFATLERLRIRSAKNVVT